MEDTSMWKEFKSFIMRGNVVDLAIAFMLGGAFGKIISSFVDDIIMPPLGLLLGRVDFTNLFINLSGTAYQSLDAAKKAGAPTINYGIFINTLVSFLIMSLALFFLIKTINRIQSYGKTEAPAAEPTKKDCPFCLSSIPLKATRCPFCTSPLSAVE
jgi:large conductance mechanosensitive channel